MVELFDLSSRDFTMAKSHEAAAAVLHRLIADGFDTLIIEQPGEPPAYWLLDTADARERLQKVAPSDEPILTVLELTHADCVLALDARSDAELAPQQCVVLRDGEVVGFYDAALEFGVTAKSGPSPPPEEDAAEQCKSVELGISTPLQVKPGEEFTAMFVAYAEAMADRAEKVLKGLSSRCEPRLGVWRCQWSKGIEVTVQLSGSHLHVDVSVQTFTWSGEIDFLAFDVRVDDHAPESTIVVKFDVAIEGFCIARLRADMDIRAAGPGRGQAQTTAAPAKTAFASYSSQDRPRVLDCIAALQRGAGMDIFLDCLSLKPSEQWKSVLNDEIASRDLFLLFWSRNTVKSPWVQWEISQALAKAHNALVQVYPLDTPEEAPPPPELSHLHFGDQIMYVRKSLER